MITYELETSSVLEDTLNAIPDPAIVGAVMVALVRRDGSLSSDKLLTAAADPAHPLHGVFEWDDHRAAELHRFSMNDWTTAEPFAARQWRTQQVTLLVEAMTIGADDATELPVFRR